MVEDEYTLRHYVAVSGVRPFADWLQSLSDLYAAAKIQVRLDRLRVGNFGDVRPPWEGSFGIKDLNGSRIPGLLFP